MMRKIGLNRPGRLGLGPKKVSPPCVPGSDPNRRVSGVYSDSGLNPDTFNSSFESFTSEVLGAASSEHGGAYASYPSEGSLYGSTRGGPSPPCRPDSLYVPRPTQNERPEVMTEQLFKEPYVPYRSASTVSSPVSQDQSPTKGSRNSMSSIDSGWASNPVPGFSSFCSRASNSSLNSDKTSFSNEDVEIRQHQQHLSQRRMSTISNGGSGSAGPPPPKRQSSTSSFTGSNQHTPRNSMRPASSQVRKITRMKNYDNHHHVEIKLAHKLNPELIFLWRKLRNLGEWWMHLQLLARSNYDCRSLWDPESGSQTSSS